MKNAMTGALILGMGLTAGLVQAQDGAVQIKKTVTTETRITPRGGADRGISRVDVVESRSSADEAAPISGDLVPLPADTLVKVRLMASLNSRNMNEGDTFPYQVAQDVRHNGVTWLRQRSVGTGVITRARSAGSFGKNGKLEITFGPIKVAGGEVPLILSKHAEDFNNKEGLAAGASLGGLLVLGPVGLLGGLFVKGKDVTIPEGSTFYVATKDTVSFDPRIEAVR